MLKIVNGFSARTSSYISPSDTKLSLPFSMVKQLNDQLEVGDHTYLTLTGYNGRHEIVKYTKVKESTSDELIVERDIDRTGALNFPPNTCVGTTFNTVIMEEFVRDVVRSEMSKEMAGA